GRSLAPVLTRAEHDAFENGYAAVNRAYADAVADEVRSRGGKALVLLQDYHFYLVAEHVREQCPDVVLTHFVHIPWPGPDEWRILPGDSRERLLRGLLGSDVVGFHTRRYARNFVLCAGELLGLPINLDELTVQVNDRTVRARYYPISVDPAALDATLASEEVAAHVAMLRYVFLDEDRQLVLRVDRTDPSKNVVRGFLAFGTLLDQHPELVGKVSFLALLQPSRTDVPEYADYIALIGAVVAEINARHTKEGRQPIDLRMVEDFALAVAAYSICDVLMVNAIADGMNLVAKEVAVVNRRGGVLALSEMAGAHEELGEFAVTLHPFDVQQMADALYAALAMPMDERHRRLAAAAEQVRTHDVRRWLDEQLAELSHLAGFSRVVPRRVRSAGGRVWMPCHGRDRSGRSGYRSCEGQRWVLGRGVHPQRGFRPGDPRADSRLCAAVDRDGRGACRRYRPGRGLQDHGAGLLGRQATVPAGTARSAPRPGPSVASCPVPPARGTSPVTPCHATGDAERRRA
ncbi:trehalose-6-phosphate synthase, partial [Glutamicibacter sp. V16R2B1]|uniref:alpha,alpha-trehalose-phosphate synthase (UDP-forming) n=1 Tax=Glutamicibacter sp. V16R2B1 TaxID=2036207 RepID=UPI001BB259B5